MWELNLIISHTVQRHINGSSWKNPHIRKKKLVSCHGAIYDRNWFKKLAMIELYLVKQKTKKFIYNGLKQQSVPFHSYTIFFGHRELRSSSCDFCMYKDLIIFFFKHLAIFIGTWLNKTKNKITVTFLICSLQNFEFISG